MGRLLPNYGSRASLSAVRSCTTRQKCYPKLNQAEKTTLRAEQWWAGYDSMPLETWNVLGFPTIYIIDHEGVIRHRQVGYDEKKDKIAEVVKRLVQKAEK